MKKFLLAPLVVALVLQCCSAQTTDFRAFSWGNSMNNIMEKEKASFFKKIGNYEIIYKDVLGSSDCDVVYILNDNGKLVSGVYFFTKKYSNPQLFIQDFYKYKALLTQKYGNPVSERENMETENAQQDVHDLGQAISDGKTQLHAVWNTERSVIKLTLISFNNVPDLQIHYTARSLDELENKEDLKSAINKL